MLFSTSLVGLVLLAAQPAVDVTAVAPERAAPELSINRETMLKMLENSKRHKPRLPLPEPTARDRETAKTGSLGLVNNGLMRRYYLPADWSTAAFPRGSQQSGLVDYAFKTELFWIISRLNNCAYCLGHQEAKLAAAGRSEEQIAALDGDWADADVATKAARRLAVLKTKTPDQPVPADVWRDLATKFSPEQQGEILLTIGNYNAMNRWTGPLNIPQEEHRKYETGLNAEKTGLKSKVIDASGKAPWAARKLGDFDTFLKAVQESQSWPRFAFETDTAAKTTPAWRVLIQMQGSAGQARLKSWEGATNLEPAEGVAVPALLRGQILWYSARLDNAPHAAAEAREMLLKLGQTDADLRNLEQGDANAKLDEKTVKALALVRLITLNPAWVGDDDVRAVRELWGDRATAQIVELACIAAAVDRLKP
jgi:alkylhydroperoxidase family enzyme